MAEKLPPMTLEEFSKTLPEHLDKVPLVFKPILERLQEAAGAQDKLLQQARSITQARAENAGRIKGLVEVLYTEMVEPSTLEFTEEDADGPAKD